MGKCYDPQELFLGLCSKALSQISGEPDAVTNLSFLTRRWKARQLDSGIVTQGSLRDPLLGNEGPEICTCA